MDNITGKRIKALRKGAGLTQRELADKLGVKLAAVNKYETGIVTNLKRSTIAKLAEIFDVSPTYIMGLEDDIRAFENIESINQTKEVPLLGDIACGEPIFAEENLEGYARIDESIKVDFALRCKGDSMINAHIFDGDLVFIHQQPDVANGEIAAVLINNEATLKRVYKHPNRLELRPENPLFPVLNYEDDQLNDIRILGKAVVFLGTVR